MICTNNDAMGHNCPTPTAPTTEDQTFNPQYEDLGACFTMMFDEYLPKPSIPVIS